MREFEVSLCLIGRVLNIEAGVSPVDRDDPLKVWRCIHMAMRSRFNLDAAKPSWRAARGLSGSLNWDDSFVDELRAAINACRLLYADEPSFKYRADLSQAWPFR